MALIKSLIGALAIFAGLFAIYYLAILFAAGIVLLGGHLTI